MSSINKWGWYKWTNKVPENNPEFQRLLEDEEVQYPNISSVLPGLEMESEESRFDAITPEPEPDFCALDTAALDNAGINPEVRLRAP